MIEYGHNWVAEKGENIWTTLDDYVTNLPSVVISVRNADYSPVLQSIKIKLAGTAPNIPQKGDKIKIEVGLCEYLGYIDTDVIFDEAKQIYDISIKHIFEKFKEVQLNNTDFQNLLATDRYNDTKTKTSGSYTLTGYTIRNIIHCMIDVACPEFSSSFSIAGPDYKGEPRSGTVSEGDFFEDWYHDKEMLFMLGQEKCGLDYKTTDDYRDNCLYFYDFLQAICKSTTCNIFISGFKIYFTGKITGSTYTESREEFNNRINYKSDLLISEKPGIKEETKRIYAKIATANGVATYYRQEITEIETIHYFPTNYNPDSRKYKEWEDIGLPDGFVLTYDYITDNTFYYFSLGSYPAYYLPLGVTRWKNSYYEYAHANPMWQSYSANFQKKDIQVKGQIFEKKNCTRIEYDVKKNITKIKQGDFLEDI